MEKRRLGNTDMEVTVLGYGSSEIGFQQESVETVEQILSAALDAGLNVIDTAECYGTAEERIGEAVSHRRDDYYLFTKCGHAAGLDLPDWDAKMLEQSIDRSLRRLRTDCIDLIQLHTCSEALLRTGEAIAVLQRARDAGKTRYIGYSGDGHAALYALKCGFFDTLQTSVNIADQECVELTLPTALALRIGVIAKRPLANVAWRTGKRPENSYHHSYWDRLQQLDYDFLRDDLSASVATALRFCLSAPAVCTAIVGTTHPGRWRANAEFVNRGPLSELEFEAIRKRWHDRAPVDWVGLA